MSTPTTAVDGRTARRSRGMDQVLDAIIELFTEGNLDPSPEQVAALAGVSGRTVYRYFEDRNALVRAAIDRHFEGIAPLAQVPQLGEGTLEERIDQMIEQKTELASQIIGSGEQWLTELNTSQLRDLLALRGSSLEDSQ